MYNNNEVSQLFVRFLTKSYIRTNYFFKLEKEKKKRDIIKTIYKTIDEITSGRLYKRAMARTLPRAARKRKEKETRGEKKKKKEKWVELKKKKEKDTMNRLEGAVVGPNYSYRMFSKQVSRWCSSLLSRQWRRFCRSACWYFSPSWYSPSSASNSIRGPCIKRVTASGISVSNLEREAFPFFRSNV